MASTSEQRSVEAFLRQYVELIGGAWDQVEPDVYDLLIPPPEDADDEELLRVALDPEALEDYPDAQFLSYGSPLLERLLQDARHRGCAVVLYRIGDSPLVVDLEQRLLRALAISKELEAHIDRIRARYVPTAIFWFDVHFTSDRKEHERLVCGVDLYYGRIVRRLEELLSRDRLSGTPPYPLPEAAPVSMVDAYHVARRRIDRSLKTLVGQRERELAERFTKQRQRMEVYYEALCEELVQKIRKAEQAGKKEQADRQRVQLEATRRTAQLRMAELKERSKLCVEVELSQLVIIKQPKLLARIELHAPTLLKPLSLEVVWNISSSQLEPPDCPRCNRPVECVHVDPACHSVCCASCATPAERARLRKARRTAR